MPQRMLFLETTNSSFVWMPKHAGGPDGLAKRALCLVVACSQDPSGWRSHKRELHGSLLLLRNPDTFSDYPRAVATPIAEERRGHLLMLTVTIFTK